MAQPTGSLFVSTYYRCSSALSVMDIVPALNSKDSDWHSLKIVSYRQDFQTSWTRIFCSEIYHSPNYFNSLLINIINDLNNTGQTLCLLQIDVISPLTPCILHSDTIFICFFECQVVRQRKLFYERYTKYL